MSGAEVQARRLLRLFPGWLRATRGEEAVGLVLDLLPPGAQRLPLRSRLDLVRAAAHARRRGTPPLRVWFDVLAAQPRNRSGMVPDAWRPWLLHQLRRRTFAWWCALLNSSYAMVVPTMFLVPALNGGVPPRLVTVLLVPAAGALVSCAWMALRRPGWRRTLLARNGCDPSGAPVSAAEQRLVWTDGALANLPLALAAGAFTAAAAAAAAALLVSGTPAGPVVGPVPSLAAVLLAIPAVVVAAIARRLRRVVRLDPGAPAEHVAVEQRLGAVAGGGLAGAATAAVVAATAGAAVDAGAVGSLVVLVVAPVGLGVLVLARRLGGRIGRPAGLWDLAPSAGPKLQLIVLAPAPPDGPPARDPAGRGPWSAAR